jgi:preprotein translocase subunit SecF
MNIVGNKKTFLTVSALLVGASLVTMGIYGFTEGIDFKGGTLWSITLGDQQGAGSSEIENFFADELGIPDARATRDAATNSFLIKLPAIGETDHKTFHEKLSEKFAGFDERSFQSIGPSVGAELRRNSLIAIVLVLLGISLYIAFAFRKVYRPVSSWKYGWITLITLFHDVAIPAALISALGHFGRVEVDGNFIVALLVIMGFSVHDTIVVFDRIRENLFLDRGKNQFSKVVNDSVNQTFARSVNTSLTLILVLVALYFTGPANLHDFVLTLLVGVTTGIYSSIFVASPLLVVWQRFSERKNA